MSKPVIGVMPLWDDEKESIYRCLNAKQIMVNSYHHQAVKKVAPPLEVMAISEDGLVEGLHLPGHHFLWAVQWHPEFSYLSDENSRKLFKVFVESCR